MISSLFVYEDCVDCSDDETAPKCAAQDCEVSWSEFDRQHHRPRNDVLLFLPFEDDKIKLIIVSIKILIVVAI